MDNRFPNPYDSASQQQALQAALEMKEAMFLRRQQELQRDLQIQRMLLQEQLDNHNQALLHNQATATGLGSLYEFPYGNAAAAGLAAQLREEQRLQQYEQLRRHQQLQNHISNPQLASAASITTGTTAARSELLKEALVADSLAANAMRKTSAAAAAAAVPQRKRSFDARDRNEEIAPPPPQKRPARSDSFANEQLDKKPASMETKKPSRNNRAKNRKELPTISGITPGGVIRKASPQSKEEVEAGAGPEHESALAAASLSQVSVSQVSLAQATLSQSTNSLPEFYAQPSFAQLVANAQGPPKPQPPPVPTQALDPPRLESVIVKGTLDGLIKAAETEDKMENVASLIANLKNTVVWPESESDEDDYDEEKDDVIVLPGFKSKLPHLPKEPEYQVPEITEMANKDPENQDEKLEEPRKEATEEPKAAPASTAKVVTKIPAATKKATMGMSVDYPYPVDTWWPSISSIRKERRNAGEKSDEEDFVEEPGLSTEDSLFRADNRAIKSRLSTDVQPGVLEKIPHCKIHRMAMKQMKVASAPDHAFCWQVTENYCNEPMVCCSICSTWRHAACGGHFKPLTVKDTIENFFVPVCDRCHEEKKILKDHPKAAARIESQRIEHLRRTLTTSAVIRQSAFAKHGGTYKWPLGSVSATHIGGHSRSVHSRHDKAEKQWADMALKLGKGSGGKAKERIKSRSRELERLLVAIEDAEGVTDRHNMMLFLERDTMMRPEPSGYEKRRRNIFDPEDDYAQSPVVEIAPAVTPEVESPAEPQYLPGRVASSNRRFSQPNQDVPAEPVKCARQGCNFRPRFDSIFCSDACGVASLEAELLRAFQYCSDIHPSVLRS